MTLLEFAENLNKFMQENPNCLGMQVITSKDDEGNGFNPVISKPSLGNFDEDDKDFISLNTIKEENYNTDDYPINSICIN